MTDPVTLTLVRYPPRNLAGRRGRRRVRVPLWGDRGRGGQPSVAAGRIPRRPCAGRRHRVGDGCRGVAAHGDARDGRRAAGAGVHVAVAAGPRQGCLRGVRRAGAGGGGGNAGARGIRAVRRGDGCGGGEPAGVADVRAPEPAARAGRVKAGEAAATRRPTCRGRGDALNQDSDLRHVGFDIAGETAGRRSRHPLQGATTLRRRSAGSRYPTRPGTCSRRLRDGRAAPV